MVRIMGFFESFNTCLKKIYNCGIITTDPQTLKSRNNLKKDIKIKKNKLKINQWIYVEFVNTILLVNKYIQDFIEKLCPL